MKLCMTILYIFYFIF